jgi:HEAT repeat protein
MALLVENRLRALLSGGDRRSIARSKDARMLVEAAPGLAAELVSLVSDGDWLVAMRALDLLEKLARDHPKWIEPYKRIFIGRVADSDKWEMRLQVVRALPLFEWEAEELQRVLQILRRDAAHSQKFVRAWAADGLSKFAIEGPLLRPLVLALVDEFELSGSKALASRAAHIRKRLAPK